MFRVPHEPVTELIFRDVFAYNYILLLYYVLLIGPILGAYIHCKNKRTRRTIGIRAITQV